MNSSNPELRLKDNGSAIKNKLNNLLTKLNRFRFVTTLLLEFKNLESDDKTKHSTFYSSSNAKTIINESDIDDAFASINSTIIPNIQKCFEKDLG